MSKSKKYNDANQLLLPFLDNGILKNTLQTLLKCNIELTITENKTSFVSYKFIDNCCKIRLHKMFLSADIETIKDIVFFIKKGKSKGLIRQFISQFHTPTLITSHKKVDIIHQGKFYNLLKLYNQLNEEYFNNRLNCNITWIVSKNIGVTKKRTLGLYYPTMNLIKISDILDSPSVPEYFIKFVIYHEMLHVDIGVKKIMSKNIAHTREFRRRETLYKHYLLAQAFRFNHRR